MTRYKTSQLQHTVSISNARCETYRRHYRNEQKTVAKDTWKLQKRTHYATYIGGNKGHELKPTERKQPAKNYTPARIQEVFIKIKKHFPFIIPAKNIQLKQKTPWTMVSNNGKVKIWTKKANTYCTDINFLCYYN